MNKQPKTEVKKVLERFLIRLLRRLINRVIWEEFTTNEFQYLIELVNNCDLEKALKGEDREMTTRIYYKLLAVKELK